VVSYQLPYFKAQFRWKVCWVQVKPPLFINLR